MKKIGIVAIVVLLVLAVIDVTMLGIGSLLFGGPKNQKLLDSMMKEFVDTVTEYTTADILETKSVYGKLNGNGNGINYFGAVLLDKDAVEDVDALMARLDEIFEIVECTEQKDSAIKSKHLQHEKLSYDTDMEDGRSYLSICFYNGGHPDSDLNDLKGH